MLSYPLPETCSLPSATQTVFLRLVEHASRHPTIATVKTILILIKSTSTLLLGLLSDETLSRFEEWTFQILRTSTSRASFESSDQILTLYCLAIMNVVCRASQDKLLLASSFYENRDLLSSTQTTSSRWNAAEMEKLFSSSSNAPKTIRLLVLQAMWASQSSEVSVEDRLDTLMLAADLMSEIPADLREDWCSKNTAVVQKLQQKAWACNLDDTIRLQAFAFICQLCKPVFLQAFVIESIRTAISSWETLPQTHSQDEGKAWIRCTTAVLDVKTAQTMLNGFLGLITSATNPDSISAFTSITRAIHHVALLAEERQELIQAALIELSSAEFTRQLQSLERSLSRSNPHFSDTGLWGCVTAWQNARHAATHELSSFLLKCTLRRLDDANPISPSVGCLLLKVFALSATAERTCTHTQNAYFHPPSPHIFIEEPNTQPEPQGNWRRALRQHLEIAAQANHRSLSHMFSRACQDLEDRCSNIEEPLRTERERSAALQQQYDQLQEAYDILEGQAVDHKFRFEAQKAKEKHLMNDLEEAQQEIDLLQNRVTKLERDIHISTEEADRNIFQIRMEKEKADLQYAAALAKKEEDIDELQQQVGSFCKDMAETKDELRTLKSALSQENGARRQDKENLERLKEELESEHAARASLNCSLQEAASDREQLEQNLASLRKEADRSRDSYERELQQVKEHARNSVETATASHNAIMDRAAAQHGEEVKKIEWQLSKIQKQLQNAVENHHSELKRRDEEMKAAEKQIERLRSQCKERDEEIQEAKMMRENLMAAMGLKPNLAHRAKPYSSQTQQQSSPIETSPPTACSIKSKQTPTNTVGDSFASHVFSNHSTGGLTPKRARPRKFIKVVSPARPRVNVTTRVTSTNTKGRSDGKRVPLTISSANGIPASVEQPHTPVKSAISELDDYTFDDENQLHSIIREAPATLERMLEDEETEI